MNDTDRRSPAILRAVLHAARTVTGVVRECNDASQRLFELRLFPDLAAADGDRAPDNYAEFVFRSPVALWREPSARRRAAGACPRH